MTTHRIPERRTSDQATGSPTAPQGNVTQPSHKHVTKQNPSSPPRPTHSIPGRRNCIALVDLLDRVLAGGVVVSGELTLSIADVDLVHVSLRALLTSVSTTGQPS